VTEKVVSAGRRSWPIYLAILGLILGLLAFEVMRELYVLEANEPRYLISPPFSLYRYGDEVHAEGIWKRSDGGSEMVEGSVVIRCVRAWNACIEVNNNYSAQFNVLNSFLDIQRNAVFSADAVEFSNNAECAIYRIRLDLKQERVTATREKLSGALPEVCAALESRVAMEMVDGHHNARTNADWTRDHFLPICRLVLRDC